MSKRWINTSVEYQWSDELGKLVQLAKEGYWYEGEMALCTNIMASGDAHKLQSNSNGYIYVLNAASQSYSSGSLMAMTGLYLSGWLGGTATIDMSSTSAQHRLNGKFGLSIVPTYTLHVAGSLYCSGSSIKYKQDLEPYTPPEGALMSLKPVQYQYKDKWKDFGKRYAGNSSKQLGFVAEDVAKVLPELAVTMTENGKEVVRNVDYEKLTVLLVSEVQSLRKEVNELKINNL